MIPNRTLTTGFSGKTIKGDINMATYICSTCGYEYDGDEPFESLPDDWVCPVCGEPKSQFMKMED